MSPKVRIPKPKKTTRSTYVWRDVSAYMYRKYKLDLHNDFYDWWTHGEGFHNGSYQNLVFTDWLEDDETPEKIKNTLRLIQKEFAPKKYDVDFWVDW